MRFNNLSQKALIPAHLHLANSEVVSDLFTFFKDVLPLPSIFDQELNLWRRQWNTKVEKTKDLSDTLTDSRVCTLMYPNITKILHLLLLTSDMSSTVERINSSLRFIKNSFRSTMGEDRFKALILLYVYKDIEIDISKVVEMYARQYPMRMLLFNPLSE
jgi:hypothetical protein